MNDASVTSPAVDTAATRIRRLRRERGWNQDELAARLGTSRKTVIQWEKHGNGPGEEYAGKLADLFGGDPDDYLADGEATPSPDRSLEALEQRLEERLIQLEGDVQAVRASVDAIRRGVESLLHQPRPGQGAG